MYPVLVVRNDFEKRAALNTQEREGAVMHPCVSVADEISEQVYHVAHGFGVIISIECGTGSFFSQYQDGGEVRAEFISDIVEFSAFGMAAVFFNASAHIAMREPRDRRVLLGHDL